MIKQRFTALTFAMLMFTICISSIVLSHGEDVEERLNEMQEEIDRLRQENEQLKERVDELEGNDATQDAKLEAHSEEIAEGQDHDQNQDRDSEISETGGLLGPWGTIIAKEIKKILNPDPPYYEDDHDDGPPPIIVPLPPPPERPSGQYKDDYKADGEDDEEEEPEFVPEPLRPPPEPNREPVS